MNWCTYSSCESWWFKQASGLASRKSNWVAVKHSTIQFKSGSTKKLFLVHVILYYELWVKARSAQRVMLFSKLVSLLSRAIWRESLLSLILAVALKLLLRWGLRCSLSCCFLQSGHCNMLPESNDCTRVLLGDTLLYCGTTGSET